VAAEMLRRGIKKGDRVALLSANRPEWAIVDFACLIVGAVLVPIYPSLSAAQVQYIIGDASARLLFAENQRQAEKASELKARGELEEIWTFDENDSGIANFPNLLDRALKTLETDRREVKKISDSITGEDLATLIYTSGTTGLPKGVMLTHGNLLSNREGALEILDIGAHDVMLSLLPLAHVFERLAGHFVPLIGGATVAYAESPLTVAKNITEVKPTLMIAVPRFYEKMMRRILEAMKKSPPLKRTFFNWALKTGRKASDRGKTEGWKLRLADKMVFSKLKERVGGRLRFFISGGAALPPDVGRFFEAAGITIIEGYGLTEASPVLSVNRLENYRFGTVGHPLPNVEIKIAEDGEILARGPNVMKGYLNLPGDTKAALDDDGFLHTGDLGRLDDDGFLIITGRKKEIMVTSSGRNIAPTPIENLLKASPYIAEIMLIADNRPFVTALIVPDFDHLESEGIGASEADGDREKLVQSRQVKRIFEYEINRLSAGLSEYERVGKFALLPKEFSIEEGELTPTLKLKREVILEKYLELIEEMYRRK
jgi:long-chain acyl-CoA synthetase